MTAEIGVRAQTVRPILQRLLGFDVGRMVHQTFGHGNVVFALPDCRPPLVVKTSDRLEAFAHTEANLVRLGALGVPVPRVVGARTAEDLAVLVLEWIPGTDLRDALPSMSIAQRIALAGQIVDIQRRVMTLPPGEGFGWTPIDQPGPFGCWFEIVDRDLHRLSPKYAGGVEPLLEELNPALTAQQPVPFLDDITVKNVIIREGRLRGIVDLDHICYGDPLYWLALTEVTVLLDVGEAAMDYCEELRRLWFSGGEAPPQLELYKSIFAAHFLGQELTDSQRDRMVPVLFDLETFDG